MAEKTQSAGIANSLTGDTLAAMLGKSSKHNMKNSNLLAFFLVTAVFLSCNKENRRKLHDRDFAVNELKQALSDSTEFRAGEMLIKDSLTAIQIAEPMLFEIYGKEKIISERPYSAKLIDSYWVISGTLPDEFDAGGTFVFIINSIDCKVLKITHYK